jgi:hypothetical protein
MVCGYVESLFPRSYEGIRMLQVRQDRPRQKSRSKHLQQKWTHFRGRLIDHVCGIGQKSICTYFGEPITVVLRATFLRGLEVGGLSARTMLMVFNTSVTVEADYAMLE